METQANATSLYDLMKHVLADSTLTPEQKVKLIDELRKNHPNTSDRWAYRWSVWILGAAVVLTILCLSILAGKGAQIPDGLVALGSAVAGGLAGLLAPAPRGSNDNQP